MIEALEALLDQGAVIVTSRQTDGTTLHVALVDVNGDLTKLVNPGEGHYTAHIEAADIRLYKTN